MSSPPPGPAAGWGGGWGGGWGPAPTQPVPGSRDLVTGEAVALELRLAKLPSRGLALLIDLALLLIPLIGIGALAAVAAENNDEALGAAIILLSIVGVLLGYPVLFETFSRGRSPGKALLGLRVVRDDGGPIRFRHALVRALVGVVLDFNPILFGAVGVLVSLGSARGKRVGDMLAGTVVIRERVPRSYHTAAVMPPHLAGWVAMLPVARVPDALALDARQVLSRVRQLDPEIARSLMAQLAGEVVRALGTDAPRGTEPAAVLSAVLAERRNRELARAGVPSPGGQPGHGNWSGPPAWGASPGWGGPPAWGSSPGPAPGWGDTQGTGPVPPASPGALPAPGARPPESPGPFALPG